MKQAIRDEYGTVGRPVRPRRDDSRTSSRTARSIPEVKDRWGIPVLRFHWQWSDHELNQVRHMQADLPRRSSKAWAGRVTRAAAGRGGRGAADDRHRRAARAAGAADRAGGSADRADQRSGRAADDGDGRARRARRLRRTPLGRQSRAAARSSTRSAPCAWATTRRRAR